MGKEDTGQQKLKPVVIYSTGSNRFKSDPIKEQALLAAMKYTSDPKLLKQAIGVRTVADVSRTLDKLAMRKEYHRALENNGISFDFIVREIKSVILSAEKESDKVNALKVLLKSVGMEKYEGEADQSRNSWEDALLKAVEDKKAELPSSTAKPMLEIDYEVNHPVIPESVKKAKKDEADFSRSIYEG